MVTPEPTPPPKEEPAKAPEPEVVDEREFKPAKEPEVTPIPLTQAQRTAQGKMQTIYFDFDKSDLSSEARRKIQSNVNTLNEDERLNVLIAGHCDERGTIEYNLALGERRASTVRDYMQSLGMANRRMTIRSYGEERPAVPGRTESAYSRNRRGEFTVGG